MKNPGLDKEEQDIIDCCGKMQVLHQMLERLTSEGHKTLVFSQFTRILDLIGRSLKLKGLVEYIFYLIYLLLNICMNK